MSKKTGLAVVKAKSLTVRLLPETELAAHVAATIADHQASDNATRQSAFYALRAGVRLVCLCDASRGELTRLIVKCKDVDGLSRATIFRYMGMARDFLDDQGLLTRRKLKDAQPVQALLTDDPMAEGATERTDTVGSALQWLKGRGIADIYKDMAREGNEAEATGGKTFGGAHGNTSASKDTRTAAEIREELEAEAAGFFTGFQGWFNGDAFVTKDADGNRPTLDEVAKMKNAPQTLSLLSDEALEEARALFFEASETAKYVQALRKEHVPVKRGKKA